MFEQDVRVSVPKSVVVHELGGEAVIVDLNRGFYFGLNDTATEMWRVLVEVGSPAAAVQSLLASHEASEETLRQDLSRLVNELVERKLLDLSH